MTFSPNDFRVSIIITSYNGRDYLVEALESVMRQTLRPFEIIIADDASTDGSQEAILSYANRHPDWIRYYLHSTNVGIPKNRNAGLRMVRGDYVGILDGDDLFVADKLERQYEALRRAPDAQAVYGNFYNVAADGCTVISKRYDCPQPEGDILANVARGNFGILRTLIADYGLVKDAGFMDERYPKYDGFWLTVKLAACCRFAYVDSELIYKRDHPACDSLNSPREAFYRDLTGIYRDLEPYISRFDEPSLADLQANWKSFIANVS